MRASPLERTSPSSPPPVLAAFHRQAFTLVELLVVVGIMLIMMALMIPAFNGIKGGGDVTKAAYDVSGALELARTYAIANNTYVWVGFYEEDGSKGSTSPATTGNGGRVVISIVTSKDGSRYGDAAVDVGNPPAFGTEATTASPQRNQVKLVQLNKLIKLDNVHLAAVNSGTTSGNIPVRPPVPTTFGNVAVSYQVGDPPASAPDNIGSTKNFAQHIATSGSLVKNPTTFQYPLAVLGQSVTAQYAFAKIIEFNPQGEASKIDENTFSGPGPMSMEIAFQPTHGSAVDSRYSGSNSNKAAAAIQIEGITGQVKIFRP